jgi:hypothetical protein
MINKKRREERENHKFQSRSESFFFVILFHTYVIRFTRLTDKTINSKKKKEEMFTSENCYLIDDDA